RARPRLPAARVSGARGGRCPLRHRLRCRRQDAWALLMRPSETTGRSDPNESTTQLRGLDQSVVAVAAPVDDVDAVGLGVAEDEEVVADELELQNRLFGAHRSHGELLRLD